MFQFHVLDLVTSYRPRSLAKQGDNALGSVRLSVRPSVCPSVCLSVCALTQKRAKKSHYQSMEFVCVSNNHADAVDRLLIFEVTLGCLNCKYEN